jgi:hypothetical protein
MNKFTSILVASVLVVMVTLSTAMPALAFPHASKTIPVDVHGTPHKIRIVAGHTNEPTFGAMSGIHDGKHNFEVLLSDYDTRFPLAGASLKVDKYYFKDLRALNIADSVNQATEIQRDITLGGVFGDPGHYMIRQVQKDGIYGYRIYGTISFFKEASIQIDETIFCSASTGPTTKFNSAGWGGSYGCTDKISDIGFPKVNPALRGVTAELGDNKLQQVRFQNSESSTGDNVSVNNETNSEWLQALIIGISGAAVAGFFGTRQFISQKV